jgi:hypothetical protein
MMARNATVPLTGRIQKRKTNHLQIVTFGLQRAAGPYRRANKRHWHAFLGLERNGCESFGSPPADGPSIASISASRGEIVPSKSKCREQQGTDADWHNQKAPGHVVDDNN